MEKMAGNVSYTDPIPSLSTLQASIDIYTPAAAKAVKGGVQATVARDAARADLDPDAAAR